ncbi:MAG: amidohydrolase [Gemmatimonadetes bacterium]|nr:amidohydrolase [Gemmatimonadota bacterium]
MRRVALPIALAVSLSVDAAAQRRPLVIDIHLHAFELSWFAVVGKPPMTMCEGAYWPSLIARFPTLAPCRVAAVSPESEAGLLESTFAALERYNVIGVASGPRHTVLQWQRRLPRRILAAAGYSDPADSVRQWAADSSIRLIGEMTWQYAGLGAADSLPRQWIELAEELDLPLGVHTGFGPAGAAYGMSPEYRMALSNPLQWESILIRHPKLRLVLMHAGWPMLDQTIGLLQAHPQVYLDISGINWFLPRPEFHGYLRRLVAAGFGRRIMHGSDQSVWPDAIGRSIAAVEAAPFLTARNKRDILCGNAARFLRLVPETDLDPAICR